MIDHQPIQSKRAVYVELPDCYEADALNPASMLDAFDADLISFTQERGEISPDELIERAYGVSRNIGDRFIAVQNYNAGRLLDTSRSSFNLRIANLKEYKSMGAAMRVRNSAQGMTRHHDLNVDIRDIGEDSPQVNGIRERLKLQDVYLSGKEVSYFMLLRTTAHEAAHVIQYDVGRVAGKTGSVAMDYMSNNGLVGFDDGDPGVSNERFAEGYAEIVLNQILVERGWDPDTTQKIVNSMSHRNNAQAIAKGYYPLSAEAVVGALEDSFHAVKEQNYDAEDVTSREVWLGTLRPDLGAAASKFSMP